MIDPSYIRNIRDGLKNENIEANNSEALPEGLVGLYDKELFPPTMKWKERKETLQFFLVFALAQKEISADFASTILGDEWCKVLANENETTDEKRLKKLNEFIQLHSKRFSSAGEGKFRLYHERFRVYILQKVSERDLAQFNQLFISLCESELKNNTEKDIAEKERYALEFLSTHYFISAMQGEKVCLNNKDAASLKNLAYDQLYWERQVKVSKGFEWSKKMLNEMMFWASKFYDDEVIECALNKVDLYHQEQNDVPRIVQLVADGDIEIALLRIEAFGSNDQEGLQRKFILYMLCLMELTLLDSKDKEHSKDSIESILSHINTKFILDISQLNWGKFFSGYLMFKIASKIDSYGLDYKVLYKNTDQWSYDWLEEIFYLNNRELEILREVAQFYFKENQKIKDLLTSKEVIQNIENGNVDYGISKLEELSPREKCITHAKIGFLLSKINSSLASENYQIALDYAMSATPFLNRFYLLIKVSKYLFFGGMTDKALKELKELLYIINEHDDSNSKKEGLYANTFRELIFQNQSIFCLNVLSKLKSKKYYERLVELVIIELVIKADFENVFDFLRKNENNIDLIDLSLKNIKRTSIKYDNFDILIKFLEESYNEYISYFLNDKSKLQNVSINYRLLFDKSDELFEKGFQVESFQILIDILNHIIFENKIESFRLENKFNYPPSKVIDFIDVKKSKFDSNKFDLDLKGVYFSIIMNTLITDIRFVKTLNPSILVELLTSNKYKLSSISYINAAFKNNLFNEYYRENLLDYLIDIGNFEEVFGLIDSFEDKHKKINIMINFSIRLHKCNKLIESNKMATKIQNELNLYFEDYGVEFRSMKLICEVTRLFFEYFDINYADYLAEKVFRQIINIKLDFDKIINLREDIFQVIELFVFLNRNLEMDEIIENIRILTEKIDHKERFKFNDFLIKLCKLFANLKLFSKSNEILLLIINNNLNNQTGQLVMNELFNNNSKEYELALSYVIESLIENSQFEEAFSKIQLVSDPIIKPKLLSLFYFKKNIFNNTLVFDEIYNSLEILKNISLDIYQYRQKWSLIREKCLALCYIAELFEILGENQISNSIWKSSITEAEKILTTRYPKRESNEVIKYYSNTIVQILETMTKHEKWSIILEYTSKIKLSDLRQNLIKTLGKLIFESEGYDKTLKTSFQFKNSSDRLYFIKGMINAISIKKYNKHFLIDILKSQEIEVSNIENIMQFQVLEELFFSNIPQEKLDRYNRTLNLQWAIDIKNQLPN